MGSFYTKKVLNSKDLDELLTRLQLGEEGAHMVHSLFHSKAITSDFQKDPTFDLVDDASRAAIVSQICRITLGEDDGAWVGPGSVGFDEKVEINWSGTCHLRPKCILAPSSPHEVGKVLRVIRFLDCPFAIRSGGHNPNHGWASIDDRGVLIDLARLSTIEISRDLKTVKIGPGLRWLEVYKAFDGTGVKVLGGRTPDVGVGGLILGGGIPNFASEFGLVCDNVIEFEVVLADSTILTASAVRNQDLFWALKGGGANFGIVTRFTPQTVPVDKIWYEARIYHQSQNERILKAISQFSQAAEEDPKASFAFSLANNQTFVAWIYSEPVEYPASFKMFYEIPFERHFTSPAMGTQTQFTASLAKVLGPSTTMRRAIAGISTRPSNELYQQCYKYWRGIADGVQVKTGANMTMGIQPITTSAVLKGQEKGGNALNLSPEPQQWFTVVCQYRDPKHDDAAHSAVQKVAAFVRETAEFAGLLLSFTFMNDANWEEDPLASYGPTNVARLKAISERYDPDQAFQLLQGGGFLLKGVRC